MAKHSSFWIGFFIAILLGGPIFFMFAGAAKSYAQQMTMILAGCVISVTFCLVVLFFCKDWLIEKFLGTTRSSVENISDSLIDVAAAYASGNIEQGKQKAKFVVRSAVAWYSWARFYRWVIGTSIAIIVAFGGFTGSILLFEQNEKMGLQNGLLRTQNRMIEVQNRITNLSLVSDFRERLRHEAIDYFRSYVFGPFDYFGLEGNFSEEPTLTFESVVELHRSYNPSTIKAFTDQVNIAELMSEGPSSSKDVVAALQPLLLDQDSTVALAALKILDNLDGVPDQIEISLSGVLLKGISLKSSANIHFRSSYLENFKCPNCTARFTNALIYNSYFGRISRATRSAFLGYTIEEKIAVVSENDLGAFIEVIADPLNFDFETPVELVRQDHLPISSPMSGLFFLGVSQSKGPVFESFSTYNPFFKHPLGFQ